MTDAAKKIINCVYETKGRYGKGIVIDTVTGAKNARLEEIGATNYKSYGTLSAVSKNLLRRLMEQLVLEGYLMVGDYQVIKLGNITGLKNPDAKVLVKITDEDKLPERTSKAKNTSKGKDSLTQAGFILFDKLRELRLEIAREEGMPPYIIFSDKTLIDMAAKVPVSESEMLAVSGVGEYKYDKYGERFLGLIKKTIEGYPDLMITKEDAEQSEALVAEVKKRKNVGTEEFYLLQEEADNYEYTDYLYISEICDEMNRICERESVKMLQVKRLMEILVAEGLIEKNEDAGKYAKVPTEKGRQLGVKVIEKVSEKGNAYIVLQYPVGIQKMLVERFIREEKQD
jgi:ATP-dependent DNA helicase RecQ